MHLQTEQMGRAVSFGAAGGCPGLRPCQDCWAAGFGVAGCVGGAAAGDAGPAAEVACQREMAARLCCTMLQSKTVYPSANVALV